MGREKIGDDVMQVRFPDGTFDRIDNFNPNRSEFIREVVLRELVVRGGGVGMRADVAKVEGVAGVKKNSLKGPGSKVSPRDADKAVLLKLVSGKRLSSSQASKALAWPGLRFSNAERALLACGELKVEGGFLVVCK